MKASFDVLERPWIPVVLQDGTRQEMGIRQVLTHAHELQEISEASPLEEYSLYRFLGLFLMDALRPRRESSIQTILQTGHFDMDVIEQYIKQCRDEGVSFDLFDEERPFLQSKYDSALDGQSKPVSVLDCTIPSGNNHTHFQHQRPDKMSPDKAAVLLLTTYWFCTAAAQGYPSGVYGAPPYFGVIKSANLFETLVNLLIPINRIGISFDEPPVFWRRTLPVAPKASVPTTSWLQGLLFPTRRISLIPDAEGNIARVYLSQGENYVNKESWRDPYVTYRNNDETIFPLRPHADVPIWRNYCDIIDIPGNHASFMINVYRTLHGDEDVHLTLYGVETSQASYLSVQRHDLTIPMKLARAESVDLLTNCIDVAQRLSRALNGALRDIEVVPQTNVSAAVQSYNKYCEDRFWTLCLDACNEASTESVLLEAFCSDISKSVLQIFDSVLSVLQLRARSLADAQTKRNRLYYEVKKLGKEFEGHE